MTATGYAAAQARYDALMPEEVLSEDGTSLQNLGDIKVLVCYDEYRDRVEVTGILMNGEFAEAHEFSAKRLQIWEDNIEAEIQQRMDGGE